ncbi:suppressor of fused domain protein [Pseudomonas brassicacearum]|uniref:suppressor of fused domain protein n=1 Tax=Pseudomonas brassicacearum TaxID=930166 RepID=UPI0009B8E2A0|nr:suppressor of fused domain protein [Pseudomonas brassicacearum]
MTLISHIENTLGLLEQGWSFREGSNPVQVVRVRNQPFDGVVTYVTLGLSDFLLSMPQEREIRQELVFTTYETFSAEAIASFMLSFCDYILACNKALLRGDVVGPSAPLIPGVAVNSVYASIPVVFDEVFSVYKKSSPHTVMVWLIPLLKEEADFVKAIGWSEFEDVLERANPDLMELNRESIV